jgi:competence protein ComEC
MLISFTGSFLAGLLLGAFLPYLPCTITLILLAVACALTVLERVRYLSFARGLILYAALLAGVVVWIGDSRPGASPVDEPFQRITGTIVEPVRYAPERMTLTVQVPSSQPMAGRPPAGEAKIRLTWRLPDRSLNQGDRIEFHAALRKPNGLLNPGGFDYAAYLADRGITKVASVTGPGGVHRLAVPPSWSRWGLWHRVDDWRNRIREAAERQLPQPVVGLFLGMIVGMAGFIPAEVRDVFMATGTVHILSISGSHLGLIAFLCFFLIRTACFRLPEAWLLVISRRLVPTQLAAFITVVPVAFYTVLAGAEIATVRSFIMICIFLLAVWLGRTQCLLTALAAAALLIVLHDPHALFDISFQLSFLSVLAIALAFIWTRMREEPVQSEGWRGLRRWTHDYMLVTVAVTLITAPVVAYHFHQVAWLGVVGNLIAVPFAGLVLVPLGLASTVWFLVSGASVLPGTAIMQPLFQQFITALTWLAGMPGAEWHVAAPSPAAIVAFYGLVLLAVHPGTWKRLRFGGGVGAALLLIWWCWSPRMLVADTVRVTFLDVGQGDASVIELPGGETVLIDAGSASDTFDLGQAVVGPFLWDRGIKVLDHVIATHPQRDHVGGLPWILRKFPARHYWDSGMARDEPVYRRLQRAVHAQGLSERRAVDGQILLASGPCRLRALNPPAMDPTASARWVAGSSRSLNNQSVVLWLGCGPQTFLFAADIEGEALDRMLRTGAAKSARVLKVPHHGARGSVDWDWLARIDPEIAVISVGRHNHYGHPAPETLGAYEHLGARTMRTDRRGAIWVTARVSTMTMAVQTARDRQPRRVRLDGRILKQELRNIRRVGAGWLGLPA